MLGAADWARQSQVTFLQEKRQVERETDTKCLADMEKDTKVAPTWASAPEYRVRTRIRRQRREGERKSIDPGGKKTENNLHTNRLLMLYLRSSS